MNQNKRVYAYWVMNSNLPRATELMNFNEGRSFSSRVVEIITGGYMSTVIVEMVDSYPCITNQWKEVIYRVE